VLVRRDGAVVRVYSRNAVNWTDQFSTIAAVAATLEAHSFTIDGEAVVIGPDGIAQFDQLRRRNGARRAMLYGFDLIELDGVDLRTRPLLERKTALAELIDGTNQIRNHAQARWQHREGYSQGSAKGRYGDAQDCHQVRGRNRHRSADQGRIGRMTPNGIIGADARSIWKEQPQRPSLSGAQWG
jgi:hypothetical protein